MDKVCKKFDVGLDYFLESGQNNHFENNKEASAIGNNYGTINNTPDNILEQIKLLIEDNKSKEEQIQQLKLEIESLKKNR